MHLDVPSQQHDAHQHCRRVEIDVDASSCHLDNAVEESREGAYGHESIHGYRPEADARPCLSQDGHAAVKHDRGGKKKEGIREIGLNRLAEIAHKAEIEA